MASVKVSVLTPIYNTNPEYLRKMIESILNQTFLDFEFLILNDSPQNKNLKGIVESYKDKRIIYLENEKNLGISGSRNKLLALAKGDYLAIFDHDDISLPTRLEFEAKMLDENPDIGVVSSNIKILGKRKIKKFPEWNLDIKRRLVNHGCVVAHSASMIRKSVLIENNIKWEEKYSPCEDYRLWGQLIDKTMFHNIQEPLILYRVHENNTTHLKKESMRDKENLIKNQLIGKYPLFANSNVYYNLFGFIPFLKKKGQNKYLLLNMIPLFKTKSY